MKSCFLFLFAALLISCQSKKAPTTTFCETIDLGLAGLRFDSLRNIGQHSKAAQYFFDIGKVHQSSEIFVYSAWQYSEAGIIDSALLAVKNAVKFGMSNPYVLTKLGLEESSKNSPFRKEVDALLEKIRLQNTSIENFEVVTTPYRNLWSYYDQAIKDPSNAEKYLSAYICNGSAPLKDYYHIRYENVDNIRRVMIDEHQRYFDYVRSWVSEEKLDTVAMESKEMMRRFAELYPKAVFPKTYLIPDLINVSGTISELGLFVGVTMFAKSDTMPLENLNEWQKSTITEFGNMKYDLVHELMHFQQSYSAAENSNILLGKLIEEGACDFLVTLLTDDNAMSPAMKRRLEYLKIDDNYDMVLNALKEDLYTSNFSRWMYNGGVITDRPSNLGYTMGYLICKSFYENSLNKKEAINELLNTTDFKKIIQASSYKEIL
ncbi:DUF2268 domain-containing putative Zn-dependent protease [Roseivirga sp.]|uniref:gliding motility protein GldB-related protein n=1 Tax=Roseivirga sp. TaxID=1964215 RepID=UPI003B8C2B70